MNELLGRFSFHSVEAEGRIEVHGQRTGSVATAEEIDELLIALNNASVEPANATEPPALIDYSKLNDALIEENRQKAVVLQRFDPVERFQTGGSAYGEMEKNAHGDFIRYEDAASLLDTIKACLVAAGGSEDDDELERQCKAAGAKPSDFIAAQFAELSIPDYDGRCGRCGRFRGGP